jgi:hypothetical protein
MVQIKVDDLGVELEATSEHRIVSFIFGETHNGAAVGGVVFCLFLRQRKTSSLLACRLAPLVAFPWSHHGGLGHA